MDLASLRVLDPEAFEEAAIGYRSVSDMASQAKDGIENDVNAKMKAAQLAGEAATAAHTALARLADNYHYIQVECGLIDIALRAFVAEIRGPHQKLVDVLAEAHAYGFTVGTDGSVTYPAIQDGDDRLFPGGTASGGPTPTRSPGLAPGLSAPAERERRLREDIGPKGARAQTLADEIHTAIAQATSVDEKWSPQLRMLMADDDLVVSAADWGNVGQDMSGLRDDMPTYLATIPAPPRDGDPWQNATWWKNLTQQQKNDYLAMYPSVVGGLDGLPADVRDEANRAVLDETRGASRTELDAIPSPPEHVFGGGEWEQWYKAHGKRYEELTKQIKGMDAIEDRFGQTGTNGLPEAYLLGFDPVGRGNGNVILANGNPDTADHVAVYVPGTDTDIGGIGGEIDRGVKLWQASDALSPDAKISTISWFNYNAPDDLTQAIHDSYAHDGAPALDDFMNGTREAHRQATGSQAHTTIIGHSYGSTLIGDAAKGDRNFAADDVIALGSPGMQADNVGQLGYTREHFFVETGDGVFSDPLHESSDFFVRGGGSLFGLGGHGNIPSNPQFGATMMDSDAKGHSDFFDVRPDGTPSLSLENQAAVITGNYDQVKTPFSDLS